MYGCTHPRWIDVDELVVGVRVPERHYRICTACRVIVEVANPWPTSEQRGAKSS